MSKGIDVSKHNGVIDWNAVKQSGEVDFAILRAGYGKIISQKDVQFEANYRGAKAAGIPVGAYWYSYAITPAEATAEAYTFLECIKGKTFEFPVYFDIEERSALATGQKNCTAMCKAFCEVMEKAGYWVGIYGSRAVIESFIDNETQNRYAIWAAEWGKKLNYHGEAGIWQYSEKGSIPGISGAVDLDISYIDYPARVKAAGKNGFKKPETSNVKQLPYIPGITVSDVSSYLSWCAEKGAGNYEDTEDGFNAFLDKR